jgi:hypothetical protein
MLSLSSLGVSDIPCKLQVKSLSCSQTRKQKWKFVVLYIHECIPDLFLTPLYSAILALSTNTKRVNIA